MLCRLLHALVTDLIDHGHGQAELLYAEQVPEPVGRGQNWQLDLLHHVAHIAQIVGCLIQRIVHLHQSVELRVDLAIRPRQLSTTSRLETNPPATA